MSVGQRGRPDKKTIGWRGWYVLGFLSVYLYMLTERYQTPKETAFSKWKFCVCRSLRVRKCTFYERRKGTFSHKGIVRLFMEILKVENLCKVYGRGENQVKALDHVSFSVQKGEFVAIIGPSGSGKSTLLHILGGVDRPTGGKVFVDGSDVYARGDEQLAIFRRRQVGLIYQFYNLIPVLDVVENITLPVLMDGRKVNEERLRELLETLKLTGREHHLPNQLSGGQQQRVSIGRALMNAPAIVLADEPTGNLDSKNSKEIVDLLELSNRKYRQTLIVITHDENIALQADRILAIEDGRIIRDEVMRK